MSEVDGRPVTVGDVATVEDSVKEPRSLSRWDNRNAVSLVVRKQSGENTIEIVDRVKERYEEIKGTLPPGVEVIFTRDASHFIREAVQTVQEHLVLGGIFAAIVVFFFLGSIRSTLIAAVAIPVSIISTYSLILWMGFTLNRMTLLALTLAVGIVIDDAIVVLENIFRFIEEKNMDPMSAAKAATAEVGLAVSATTLSLAVIFVPVAFIHGVMGRFLNSFGLTMAFAIMVSLLVSFTLTPMLCSRYLKPKGAGGSKHNNTKDWKIFRWIEDYYDLALRWSLDHRWVLVAVAVALVISIPFLGKLVGATFMPDDDSSEFAVNIRTPPGYSLAHTDEIVAQIEDRLRTIPEVRDLFTTVGDTNGDDRVTVAEVDAKLFPLDQRQRSQELVMADARKLMDAFPVLRISVDAIKPWEQSGYRDVAVEYDMRGPDLETLRIYADSLMKRLRKIPGIVDLDSSYEGGLPELQVNIDRDKSADLGVSVDDIAQTMRTMVQGDVVTRFREGQDTYDVRLQLADKDRNNPVVVAGLTIPSSKVGQVRLDNVATLTHGTGPVQIDRQDRHAQHLDRLQPRARIRDEQSDGRRHARGRADSSAARLRHRVRRPEQDLRRDGHRLSDRLPVVGHLHVHGAGGAVRELHPSDHDHVVAAAGRSVRADLAVLLSRASDAVLDARHPAAVRHREKEFDPAARSNAQPDSRGPAAAPGDPHRQSRSPASDPHDDGGAGRGHDPGRDRAGRR